VTHPAASTTSRPGSSSRAAIRMNPPICSFVSANGSVDNRYFASPRPDRSGRVNRLKRLISQQVTAVSKLSIILRAREPEVWIDSLAVRFRTFAAFDRASGEVGKIGCAPAAGFFLYGSMKPIPDVE